MSTIVVIDYTSRDFNSIVADLRLLAPQLLPEWTSTSDTDFGVVLMDLFAYVGDINNYYVDRVANEVFLASATLRSSVVSIANMLGYVPIAMTPATVSLRFTTVVGAGAITIAKGTQVSTLPQAGADSVIFETDVDLVILGITAATPTYVGDVAATQGITITNEVLTDNANGSANQSYSLFKPNVVEGSVVVTVLEPSGVSTRWTQINTLLNSTSSGRVFEALIDDNDVMLLTFGDNADGRIPPSGSIITATYRYGIGVAGNVGAGLLTEMVQPHVNVTSVTNQGGAAGGADAETIASMQQSIPRSLFSLQRAVTLKDYAALAIQYPGVAKAQATATVYTSVLLYVAPVGGGVPTTTLRTAVSAFLADKKLVNVTITTSAPTYVNVNITATVHVLENFYQPTVKTMVTNALQTLLSFDSVEFDTNITVSKIYHAIQAVEGVDYATLSLVVRGDAATQAGVQDASIGAGEIPQLGSLVLTMLGGVS